MAPGHKRMRIPFRDRIPKNPSIHKKLEFLDEAAQMKHDSVSTPVIQKEDEFTEIDWLSPCHTRSGTVYEPDETLTLSDIKRKDSVLGSSESENWTISNIRNRSTDSDSDASDNVSEESSHEIRSGLKPKKLTFANIGSSESDSDVSDNVFEGSSREVRPLEECSTPGMSFSTPGMSPIVRNQFINKKSSPSPCFLRRRPRTSTRVIPRVQVPETPQSRAEANTNPYSPAVKRQKRRLSSSSLSSGVSECDSEDSGRYSPDHGPEDKRLRLSDLSILRYDTEFLQTSVLASGMFGTVKLARHRLDGTDYAIKVNNTALKPGSSAEKKIMNEVFAHASLNNSQHVVRYFNSWVEEGYVYIQNEFCNGGSYSQMIDQRRESGEHFTEEELLTTMAHCLKGLKYIHGMQMAHMDIKPENILVSLDRSLEGTDVSIDSGAESDDPSSLMEKMELREALGADTKVVQTFKIGDLGHITSVVDSSLGEAEEGDCRYMADELFRFEKDRSKLQKADIFSLGLTMFEAASLLTLPKNSLDTQPNNSLYAQIRLEGTLPFLDKYSRRFNNILKSMIRVLPDARPTASKLLKQVSSINKNRTDAQLSMDLIESQKKLEELQKALLQSQQ